MILLEVDNRRSDKHPYQRENAQKPTIFKEEHGHHLYSRPKNPSHYWYF
jgi:hypothetical protein